MVRAKTLEMLWIERGRRRLRLVAGAIGHDHGDAEAIGGNAGERGNVVRDFALVGQRAHFLGNVAHDGAQIGHGILLIRAVPQAAPAGKCGIASAGC
jgi:hypothetical protein